MNINPALDQEFKAILGSIRPCLRKIKIKSKTHMLLDTEGHTVFITTIQFCSCNTEAVYKQYMDEGLQLCANKTYLQLSPKKFHVSLRIRV